MRLLLIFSVFCLCQGPLFAFTEPIGLLCNLEVPAGREMAKKYAFMHGLSDNVILEFTMPIDEKISMDVFEQKIKKPLREKLKSSRKDRPLTYLLSFYGVPVFVQDGNRIRSVDQMLSLVYWDQAMRNNVVENPYYHKGSVRPGHPLLVCRLDAPSSSEATVLLHNWMSVQQFGPWKRYLTDEKEKVIEGLLKKSFLFTQSHDKHKNSEHREIQYESLTSKELSDHFRRKQSKRYNFGALVIKNHGSSDKSGRFRSKGHSDVSAALLNGAAFYIGAHRPHAEHEDQLNKEHFFERYLNGEPFASAVYGSMFNLAGSMVIIGDPLFNPFNPKRLSTYAQTFELSQLPEDDQKFIALYTLAKDWWLLRECLKDWQNERFNMAIGKLYGAYIQRDHAHIFAENLSYFYQKMGYDKRHEKLMRSWLKRNPPEYYKKLVLNDQNKAPEK